MDYNPYRSPGVGEVGRVDKTTAQRLRQAVLWHEASIRGVGSLFFFVGVAIIGISVGVRFTLLEWIWIPFGVGVLYGAVGAGLRTRRKWSYWPGVCLSLPFLALIPVGTAFGGYVLWLLLSERGRYAFSSEYEILIRRTPDERYRTPLVSWLAMGMVAMTLTGIVIWALVSS